MLLTVVLVLLVCIVLVLRLWFKNIFSYWTQFKVPSAKGTIFSGNFGDFITLKTNFAYHLKTIYDDPKFENEAVVGIYGAYKPGLLIRDPELLKTVFIKDFDKFCDRAGECNPHRDPLSNLGLFFARYSYWKEMRPKISPIFTSGKLKYIYPLLQQVGKNLEENLAQRSDKFVEDLKCLCGLFTTDSISSTVLGFQSNALQNPKDPIYLEAITIGTFNLRRALSFFVMYFLPRFTGILRAQAFDDSTYNFIRSSIGYVISEREKTGQTRNDVIDIFVKLKKEASEAGEDETLTMDGLFAQALILMAGGFETSSTVISSALFELAKQPQLLEKLRTEVLESFLEGDGQISYESINSMEYLRIVIDETLRKYPVFPLLDRKFVAAEPGLGYSLKPFYDYDLPDGMPVYISVYALHYDPKYWPNPKKFDPERFSAENRKHIEPMAYLPFGNGPHNCVGSRLGLLQVKIAILHILKNHYVQVCDRTVLEPEFDPKAFVLQVKGGIHLEIVRDNMFVKACNK